jgi:hypothetical protein
MDDKPIVKIIFLVGGGLLVFFAISTKGRKAISRFYKDASEYIESVLEKGATSLVENYAVSVLVPATNSGLVEEIKKTWNKEGRITPEQAENLRKNAWKLRYDDSVSTDFLNLELLSKSSEDSTTTATSFYLLLFRLHEENYDFAQRTLGRNHDGISGLAREGIIKDLTISAKLPSDSFVGINMSEI